MTVRSERLRRRALVLTATLLGCGGDDVAATASADASTGNTTGDGSSSGEVGSSSGDATASSGDSSGIAPPQGECGNGILELGEDCDDGKDGDPDDGCTDLCQLPRCGDGLLQTSLGEQCDVGDVAADHCTAGCRAGLVRGWIDVLGTADGGDDEARGVALDADGNVVAVGRIDDVEGNGFDVWVRKYDPSGTVLWTTGFDSGVSSSFDRAYAVAVCEDGRIIVGGEAPVLGQGSDALVLSFEPDGTPGWTATHQGAGGFDDGVYGVACAGQTVLVAGYEFAADDVPASGWYSALDLADGAEQWNGAVVSGPSDFAFVAGVAAGPAGEWALSGITDDDNWIRVLESDGTQRWEQTFDAIADADDVASAVAFTPDGDVLVAGSNTHAYVRRLGGADGSALWSGVYAGSEGDGAAVAATDDGLVVLVGGLQSTGTSGETPVMYGIDADAGGLLWTQLVFDGGVTGAASAVAAGPAGAVAVAGDHTPHAFDGTDLWVARYAPSR